VPNCDAARQQRLHRSRVLGCVHSPSKLGLCTCPHTHVKPKHAPPPLFAARPPSPAGRDPGRGRGQDVGLHQQAAPVRGQPHRGLFRRAVRRAAALRGAPRGLCGRQRAAAAEVGARTPRRGERGIGGLWLCKAAANGRGALRRLAMSLQECRCRHFGKAAASRALVCTAPSALPQVPALGRRRRG
jgi:hypothetical protein